MNKLDHRSPVSFGIQQGAKIAALLAALYAILGTSIEFVRQAMILHNFHPLMLPIGHILGMIPFGLLFAFVPSVSLGMITGGLIGELWLKTSRFVNGKVFTFMVFLLCLVIVFAVHFIFGIQVDLTFPSFPKEGIEWAMDGLGMMSSYPYLIGWPSLIYVVTGPLVSHYYWKKFVSPSMGCK